MKKTKQIKTVLLITALTFLRTIPTFAGTIVGSIDSFNGSQIHGWAYDTEGTCEADELQIKIIDRFTGDIVQELTADPNTQRSDLTSLFGQEAAPGFTVAVDLSNLPDGVYSAAGYCNDTKITGDAYYLKGITESGEDVSPRSLGTFRLTAYCPCRSCSEGWGRRTSSGAIATANHTIAADRRVLPMGSKVMIDGVIYTVEDVGGGVRGNHIDIFFDSHAQSRQFGSRHAEVFLIQ